MRPEVPPSLCSIMCLCAYMGMLCGLFGWPTESAVAVDAQVTFQGEKTALWAMTTAAVVCSSYTVGTLLPFFTEVRTLGFCR